MQDLTEAYFSIYEDYDDLSEETRREYLQKKFNRQNRQNPGSAHKYIPGKQNTGAALQAAIKSERHMRGDVDEGRAFSGGPDLAHTFPSSPEDKATLERIKREREAQAAERAKTSPTKSASKPPTTEPEQKPTPRRSRGKTNKSGDTWQASTNEQVDFYDLVLDYLLDEGYADTEENAISMMSAMSEDWINIVVERFSMANDISKPQSPKPTKLPRSREANIGRHDDWKDKPSTEWGDRPPAGKKLKSRASAVVGTQRRQDMETGIR